MKPYYAQGRHRGYHGDCLAVMRDLAPASVDAVVTDPPYNLTSIVARFGAPDAAPAQYGTDGVYARTSRGFMGQTWDGTGIPFRVAFWEEVRRVLKPGGHLVAFGGSRTYHRMACAIEDAGFEIRDSLFWVHAQGFPKSLDISKALDREAGAGREVVGQRDTLVGMTELTNFTTRQRLVNVTAPATDLAAQWDGWGTALKPAQEPIVLARAPLSEPTIAANVARWGTGGLNIAACRVGTADTRGKASLTALGQTSGWNAHANREVLAGSASGRWPPNLVFSHSLWCGPDGCADGCPVAELDGQSGTLTSGTGAAKRATATGYQANAYGRESRAAGTPNVEYGDTGGASRFYPVLDYAPDELPWVPFYYTPKPDRAERDRGCEALPHRTGGELTDRAEGSAGLDSPRAGAGRTSGGHNHHPTVKPQALMRWLCQLVTPPGGVVLDPFGGSGTTVIAADQAGFASVYIDQDADYCAVARARLRGDAPLFATLAAVS